MKVPKLKNNLQKKVEAKLKNKIKNKANKISKIGKNKINKINSYLKMDKLKNETLGQIAAEYILLFRGVIVIAIVELFIYKSYFEGSSSGLNTSEDVSNMRNAMNNSG